MDLLKKFFNKNNWSGWSIEAVYTHYLADCIEEQTQEETMKTFVDYVKNIGYELTDDEPIRLIKDKQKNYVYETKKYCKERDICKEYEQFILAHDYKNKVVKECWLEFKKTFPFAQRETFVNDVCRLLNLETTVHRTNKIFHRIFI